MSKKPETHHLSHSRRKLRARCWLVIIFAAISIAHFFFYRFSTHNLNPYPITRGLTFGFALWTTALMLAMWLRQGWARYVMIVLLAIGVGLFGMLVMLMNSQLINPLPEAVHAALGGMILYGLALIPLGISRSLRRFLAPRTAGGG